MATNIPFLKFSLNDTLIEDRSIAVSYMIEALRIFDHYHFRINQKENKNSKTKLTLQKPPIKKEKAWWHEYYSDKRKIKDREMFS